MRRARLGMVVSRLFRRDTAWVLLARLLQNANGLLLSVLLVRRFGIAAAGTLAVATTAIVVLGLIGTFGLPYTLARNQTPLRTRNSIGFAAAMLSLPLCLPPILLLGLAMGRSPSEAIAIALLALGGPFFAQCNIVGALQILRGRPDQVAIAPACNLLGLAIGAGLADTMVQFVALLTLCRFAGVLLAFLLLPRAPLRLAETLAEIRRSVRYLFADGINLGTDQLTVLGVSLLISRGELGLLGLCRQLLTVSDTPGWSEMQASYPAAVADPDRVMPAVRRRMLRLGSACGAGVACLSIPLGIWGYDVAALAVLGPVLLSSVPLRYLLSVLDMRLRATGAVRSATAAAALRCILGLLLVPGGAIAGTAWPGAGWEGGALGAILGMILHTAIAVAVTSRMPRIAAWWRHISSAHTATATHVPSQAGTS